MTTIINADEISEIKEISIPVEVLEAFDELILRGWDGHSSIVFKSELINIIKDKLPKISGSDIVSSRWCDGITISIYERVGWKITHIYPDDSNDFKEHFIFKKKFKWWWNK